jgi:hypothetical protein
MLSTRVKYYLYGPHSEVSVLSYTTYEPVVSRYLTQTKDPAEADLFVVSYGWDMKELAKEFLDIYCDGKPVVILCEEPIWDTICQGHNLYDYTLKHQPITIQDTQLDVTLLNHCTSDIFEYDTIPHFITTNKYILDHYLKRSVSSIEFTSELTQCDQWSNRKVDVAGLFGNIDNDFHRYDVNYQVRSMSKFRTDLAKHFISSKYVTDFAGQDWPVNLVGDSIYNKYSRAHGTWHEDKLDWLQDRSRFAFALENSVVDNYVTEKIFDVISTNTIPIYYLPEDNNMYDKIKGLNVHDHDIDKLINDSDYLKDLIQQLTDAHVDILETNWNFYTEWLQVSTFQPVRKTCVKEIQQRVDRIYCEFRDIVNPREDSYNNIGVVTACMNRPEMLNVSIQSWLNCEWVDEIVIVDWNSTESLKHLEVLDQRVRVVRVEDEEYFNIGRAYNLAVESSTCEKILKLDVDYILNPYYNFNEIVELKPGAFITGNIKDDTLDNNAGFVGFLNGLIYMYRQNFLDVNGYDNQENYGWDDDALYSKLLNHGLKRELLDLKDHKFVYHNPHDDAERVKHYELKETENSIQSNQEAWWVKTGDENARKYHITLESM